jgi:BON domain
VTTSFITWAASAPDLGGLLARWFDMPRGVSVRMRNGHVTLEGTVAWNYERVRTELAARQLPGVRSVFNNILVKPVWTM